MVQIKCLSNGLYSLKNSHIPFGMGFQPPAPYGGFPFEQHFSYKGASLTSSSNSSSSSTVLSVRFKKSTTAASYFAGCFRRCCTCADPENLGGLFGPGSER